MAEQRQGTLRIASVVVVVIVLLLAGGALMLTRSIQRPLTQAIQVADRIAAGDLSTRVQLTQADEFGHLLRALERMAQQLSSVVGEVAQRSAAAAREIKTLIGASVERVESGAGLVTQTGAVMEEIVSSVKRVTDPIGEIASAATEQRDGIAQVNVAVSNLDQMTQQNAALVEQSAAAAQSLREQAQRLAEVVSVFKV
ncbi:HAMP domain-containing protein [Roseateles toxinivorans]|uniref:HAMP domain-containing protein n=2 Tax=Roseateles toxinivorans TaxID=270368 RepID=A0A4R6QFC6_9BURK|nr:HAMP domain-containing protein [Roseateles toxinivorans]